MGFFTELNKSVLTSQDATASGVARRAVKM